MGWTLPDLYAIPASTYRELIDWVNGRDADDDERAEITHGR